MKKGNNHQSLILTSFAKKIKTNLDLSDISCGPDQV